LEELTFDIADKPTLEALGQICERADLSNGPRTVANAFRRVASYYASNERTYTPLQLIDDFLTGAIIFDGDANTIASLVTEFAGYAYFKRTDKHLAVLKLLAAFPSGCLPEVAERYDLLETFNEITSELRGDIITLLPSGYALIDLQRVGKPLNKLSLILKKYWMQISNNEEEPAEDIRRFAQYVLPLLFPTSTTQTETWKTETALSLSADGAYTQTFVGYLHTRHPLRRVRVTICIEELPPPSKSPSADIDLMFVIHNSPIEQQRSIRRQDSHLIFHLNIGRVPHEGLPVDLRLVEHNLSPQPGTPSVLLNVIEFVEREVSLSSLKQSEVVQVSYTLENMRRWLLNFIFDEQLLGSLDLEAATPGYRGIRDLLFRECERRYPHYSTLITSTVWQDNLARYREVLAERTLAERRGIEPVHGPKSTLAALFGQRNHAGFDSKMRVQYPYLLDITWTGEEGSLLFTPHSIETKILAFLGDEGCDHEKIADLCKTEGYAREEIAEIFALLVTRGQIKEEEGLIHKTDTLSIAELRRIGKEFTAELEALEIVFPREILEANSAIARSLAALDTDNDTNRQKGHAQLILLTESVTKLRIKARLAFLDILENQKNEVATLLRGLDEKIPGFSAPATFKNHLDGVRKLLEDDSTSMRRGSARLREVIQSTRNRVITLGDAEISTYLAAEGDRLKQRTEALNDLRIRFERYRQRLDLLKQWVIWGEYFVRLKYNISNLVVQLKQTEPSSIHLGKELNSIESEVRESLSHQGVAALQQIAHIRHRLDEVAKEYDRNLSEREMAFEKEKAALNDVMMAITDGKAILRGKYQISKHEESYHDLYGEALQIIQTVVEPLASRVQLLDTRLRSARRTSTQGSLLAGDQRALKTLARKVIEGQKTLLSTQESRDVLPRPLIKEFTDDLLKLRKQLDDIDQKVPIQVTFSLSAGALLTKLGIEKKDLGTLIDVKAAMLSLPFDSDLKDLLDLYFNGDITIEVHLKSDRTQADN
jgi:hypothetical protein